MFSFYCAAFHVIALKGSQFDELIHFKWHFALTEAFLVARFCLTFLVAYLAFLEIFQ